MDRQGSPPTDGNLTMPPSFPKWMHKLTHFQPRVSISEVPHPSQHVAFSDLSDCQSDECVIIYYCSWHLRFPHCQWAPFHVFFGNLDVLFCEVPVPGLCQFPVEFSATSSLIFNSLFQLHVWKISSPPPCILFSVFMGNYCINFIEIELKTIKWTHFKCTVQLVLEMYTLVELWLH